MTGVSTPENGWPLDEQRSSLARHVPIAAARQTCDFITLTQARKFTTPFGRGQEIEGNGKSQSASSCASGVIAGDTPLTRLASGFGSARLVSTRACGKRKYQLVASGDGLVGFGTEMRRLRHMRQPGGKYSRRPKRHRVPHPHLDGEAHSPAMSGEKGAGCHIERWP